MKSIRNFALAAMVVLGAFSAIMYSSCSKSSSDPCSGVTCHNGGSCSSGTCTCKTGFGGTYCDTTYRLLYTNTYKGTGTDNESPAKTYLNSHLTLTAPSDTNYAGMNALVELTDSAGNYHTLASFPIVLSNFSLTSGTTFTITSTVYSNGFRYTGTGTVSASMATLSLTETDTATVSPLPTIVYTWGNMSKM